MTEAEWLAATDPIGMLRFLKDRASARKMRLFGCAWGYSLWDRLSDERSRQALLTAERFAEGQASAAELGLAYSAAEQAWNELPEVHGNRRVRGNKPLRAARRGRSVAALARDVASPRWGVALALGNTWMENSVRQLNLANLLRDVFGLLPFRSPAIEPSWLTQADGAVRRIAGTIYQERAFEQMPVLGDALEEAGCTDAAILDHCRQVEEHSRGCWIVDLLIGRE
jgi:hypothetical protein